MSASKQAPVIPRPDFGSPGTLDLGGSALPFSAIDRRGEVEGIVVQIKVLSDDDAEGTRVMGVIESALKGVEYNGKRIVPVITSADVDMSKADQEKLAAYITPIVMKRLGIRSPMPVLGR